MRTKQTVFIDIPGDKAVLLIKNNSGTVYQQQANGVCCEQYYEEGDILELDLDLSDFCCGIDYDSFEIVSKINRRISESDVEKKTGYRIKVLTNNGGVEAWLPVEIKRVKNKNKYKHLPNKSKAFLLWNNCD